MGWGRQAEHENYESLASTGHWISFGHTTGALPPLDPGLQSAKSLRVSRPVLFHYTDDPVRLRAMAANVFVMLQRGVLRVTVRHRFPLSAAAAALDALDIPSDHRLHRPRHLAAPAELALGCRAT